MERVSVYIDGFNLYYGLKAAKYKQYYWLDLVKLSRNLLRSDQSLVITKYFTARIIGAHIKRRGGSCAGLFEPVVEHDIVESLFTRMSAECEADFLTHRRGCADHR